MNEINKVQPIKAPSNADLVKHFDGIKSVASAAPYEIIQDVSVRAPFTRQDYDNFRPNEKLFRRFPDVINACRAAYDNVGIIRNVIDMMIDFTCEDLKFVHENKEVELFFKNWQKKINLDTSVEEFAKHFLIDQNVVVKRVTAKIPVRISNEWKATAAVDPADFPDPPKPETREIPWRYIFLDVAKLEWLGTPAELMMNKMQLGYTISNRFSESLCYLESKKDQSLADLPSDIREAVKSKGGKVPLDMSKLHIAYGKKDSWELWAKPFLKSVIEDVKYKSKLRQAELSALDGFINVIRLWKLGDHTNGILPEPAAFQKLANILNTNTGGGAIDIIWDSMIEMKDFYPPLDKILGAAKYEEVNHDILVGLGVPDVLLGGKGGNFSNAFIQLKTLIERLKAVRAAILKWLDGEVEMICQAMGFAIKPKVKFSNMSLQDESAKQKMILGLLDRNIVSVEAVLDVFGEDYDLEVRRIPEEVSEFKKKKIERFNPLDQKKELPTNGRPTGTKDTGGRDFRNAKPRTKASLVFAMDAIDWIDDNIIPSYMNNKGVKNARQLTSEQKDDVANARLIALSCIKEGDDLANDDLIKDRIASPNLDFVQFAKAYINDFVEENKKEPTQAQRKRLEAMAWADFNMEAKNA